jgi:hypothetical protein
VSGFSQRSNRQVLQAEFGDPEQLAYFRDRYAVAAYKVDLYHLFIEQGLRLTRPGGIDAMITPANFLTNNYLVGLRRLMLDDAMIDSVAVVDRGVFPGRSVDNLIYVLRAGVGATADFALTHMEPSPLGWTTTEAVGLSGELIRADKNYLFTGGDAAHGDLWAHVAQRSVLLKEIADVNFGKQLRDRKQFTKDVIEVKKLTDVKQPYRPCYTGSDVGRYRVGWNGLALLDSEEARRGGCWDADKQNATGKLLTKQIGRYPDFGIDNDGFQCLNTMFMVNSRDEQYSRWFLLGYLNSSLIRALWLDRFYDRRRTFPKIKGTYLKELFVPRLDDEQSRATAREIGDLAARITELALRVSATTPAPDARRVERAVAVAEARIDELVLTFFELDADKQATIRRILAPAERLLIEE